MTDKTQPHSRVLIAGITLAVVLIIAIVFTACSGGGKPVPADTDIVIPVSDLSSTAKFYPMTVEGTPLEVIAVTAPDGSVRTAFNTCQVCYGSGQGYYKQDGDVLVCQNCGNRFSMERVEVESGGCNPVPIFDEYTSVSDDNITIPYDLLKEAKVIFSNWKTEY